jgi:hypothetical protein
MVGNVLGAIERRDWEKVRLLLHPDVHWTTPIEEHVRGHDRVMEMLAHDPPPGPPAYHELRDGRIYRWIDKPG